MMDTKKEAEEKALEFACEMINKGHEVRRMDHCLNEIHITYGEKYIPFRFTDLVPGDICIASTSIATKLFFVSYINKMGVVIFVDEAKNIRGGEGGFSAIRYKKTGVNFFELTKED